jgi:hypothetical protein
MTINLINDNNDINWVLKDLFDQYASKQIIVII